MVINENILFLVQMQHNSKQQQKQTFFVQIHHDSDQQKTQKICLYKYNTTVTNNK